MMDRRNFLLLFFATASVASVLATASGAVAKDGGDDDGGDDDGGDSGDDDSGSDSNSGSDGGDDDSSGGGSGSGGDDDDDDDSEDGGSGSGSGSGSGGSKSTRDHQRAREAVDQGRILPLREILKRVETLGGGRVIAVDLNLEARKPYYTLKVQSGVNVKTLKLDAVNGRRLNFLGW